MKDSGCTNYMIKDRDSFVEFETRDEVVSCANNSEVSLKSKAKEQLCLMLKI